MKVSTGKFVTQVTVAILLTPVVGVFNLPLNNTARNSLNELSGVLPAIASTPSPSKFEYNPPERGIPKTTQGTGSRGCTLSEPVTVTLLVPQDHTGQTISAHPSFLWHVSGQTSIPIEFALVEPGIAKPLFVQRMQVEKGGIMQLELPKDLPQLETGRKYRWSISLLCNSNRPSSNVFVQSWIERVAAKPELSQQLANEKSQLEQAKIYGAAGLWYDALAAISTAYNENPSDRAISQARFSLFDQVGLTQIAASERQPLASN
jgi:Domain of Unknown Function (DUF928)